MNYVPEALLKDLIEQVKSEAKSWNVRIDDDEALDYIRSAVESQLEGDDHTAQWNDHPNLEEEEEE